MQYIVGYTIADVTGENTKDMIICTSRETIWLKNINKADYTYEERNFSGHNGIFSFYPADYNKDGALDFAFANYGLQIIINKIPQVPSGVSDLYSVLKVHPNPTNHVVNITDVTLDVNHAYVYNLMGTLVLTADIVDGKIDLSTLISGQYVMRILDKSGNLFSLNKIIKH
jgi:hypothetical protein